VTVYIILEARNEKQKDEEYSGIRAVGVRLTEPFAPGFVSHSSEEELPRKSIVTQQKQQSSEPKRKYVPPTDHPWRRYSLQTQRISQALPV